MKSFQWDENFETGIKDVDDQHRYLVELVNKYGDLIAENTVSQDDAKKALSELTGYTTYHFHEEEVLMHKAGIATQHFEIHREQHQKFIDDINEFAVAINNSSRENLLRQLLEYLIQWLVCHILGSDQNMARQISAIEDGLEATEAYSREEREHKAAVGPLLTALQTLFEQVSERNKELIFLNQSLEKKVEQRTKQLSLANQRLEVLSYTDVLTQLPNRRYALRELDQLWEESVEKNKPMACMLIDVDKFKEVNDTSGHDAGDEVLVKLSERFLNNFRKEDTVCRLGGDEFLAICPGLNLTDALELANHVLGNVNQIRMRYGDYCWEGSISVGVSERRQEMTDSRELIKAADNAVYKAKSLGRNQVCYTA